MAKRDISKRRFLVYKKEGWNKDSIPLEGFETYTQAQEYANTLDFPARIEFNQAGVSLGRKRNDFEFKTNSGKTILMKWEKVEFRAYRKDGADLIELKLGATVPDALIKYIDSIM